VAINDLEHIHRSLQSLVQDLDLDSLQMFIDGSQQGYYGGSAQQQPFNSSSGNSVGAGWQQPGCDQQRAREDSQHGGPLHAEIEGASSLLGEVIVSIISTVVGEVGQKLRIL
jgi:hypothetical protein